MKLKTFLSRVDKNIETDLLFLYEKIIVCVWIEPKVIVVMDFFMMARAIKTGLTIDRQFLKLKKTRQN